MTSIVPASYTFPSFTLSNGYTMPVIGLGTWRTDNSVLKAAIHTSLRLGYRHFDCAALYFNEHIIGEAIAEAIEQGVVTREELFITSKLMPTDMHEEHALEALEKTLKNLKVQYLDLYLLHWPCRLPHTPSAFPVPEEERLGYDADAIAKIWRLLEGAVDQGLIRSLGVSNFTCTQLSNLLTTTTTTHLLLPPIKHKPVNNQVEMHPALQQAKLLAWHKQHNILLTTYCPLGSPGRPPTFCHGDTDPDILRNENVVGVLAAKYSITPAQVVLRWAVQRGTVPLPKSVTPSRLEENLKAVATSSSTSTETSSSSSSSSSFASTFFFTEEDMKLIESVDQEYRFSRGQSFAPKGMTWEQLWIDKEIMGSGDSVVAVGAGGAT